MKSVLVTREDMNQEREAARIESSRVKTPDKYLERYVSLACKSRMNIMLRGELRKRCLLCGYVFSQKRYRCTRCGGKSWQVERFVFPWSFTVEGDDYPDTRYSSEEDLVEKIDMDDFERYMSNIKPTKHVRAYDRLLEVLKLARLGYRTVDVAKILGITKMGVRWQVSQLRKKWEEYCEKKKTP